jgi:hypothetical protein
MHITFDPILKEIHMKRVIQSGSLTLALAGSIAHAQDGASVDTSRVIVGQMEQLPLGVKAPCDRDNVGRLSLEISDYSFFYPLVSLCVQKERWGKLEYAKETMILSDDYAGKKVQSAQIGSAVVWNSEADRVEGFVLSAMIDHTSGLACKFQSNVTQGSGSCGIQWKDSDRKDFLIFKGNAVNVQLAGQSIEFPLTGSVILENLPAQTPDDLLNRLLAEADADKRSEYLSGLSMRLKQAPDDTKLSFAEKIHGLVLEGEIEKKSFHTFLGNMGLEYGVQFARELLDSNQPSEVRDGLNIVRQVSTTEVRGLHVEVFKRFYPAAVDVGSRWGDFASASVIRDVIGYLKTYGTAVEKDQIRAIRDATTGMMHEVESYLRH